MYRPRRVIIACGDGNFQLRKVRWRTCNRSRARGTATAMLNDCNQYCAAGRRATIIASRPRICRHGDGAEGYHYTRLQIRYRRPLSTSAFPGAAPKQRRGIYNGGNEYVLTNTAVVIALAFSGAGKWSADNAIGRDVAAIAWGLGALGRQ